MCEIKKNLKNLEYTYKIFHQQQFTFIAALDRCRENAHDQIKAVATLGQVNYYLENHCSNSTDRRIMNMFLDLLRDLCEFCKALEKMETDERTAGGYIALCKTLLSPSNDLTCLRARYPHDQVNHLSCNEARNYYGGVVSVIPVILDNLKLGVSTLEKPQPTPRLIKQSSSTCALKKKGEAPTAKAGSNTCPIIKAPPVKSECSRCPDMEAAPAKVECDRCANMEAPKPKAQCNRCANMEAPKPKAQCDRCANMEAAPAKAESSTCPNKEARAPKV